MQIPRVGDVWKFHPTKGKKHTTIKKIKSIRWGPSLFTSKNCPWIEWEHTPKARYLGDIRVKSFLQYRAVERISQAKQQATMDIRQTVDKVFGDLKYRIPRRIIVEITIGNDKGSTDEAIIEELNQAFVRTGFRIFPLQEVIEAAVDLDIPIFSQNRDLIEDLVNIGK